ncbi:ferric-dicitrate binding protein FerR (iron transport regulator) [Pedobacter africanus]|uniref:Ferric-dicitrate binding protein FerR (Iron transport regulator) n=1 Tax=Pedobacter africanus TaxID=151894 RepID=A0ACC6KSM1_9SPHI|nr:FecR domain-containing protein [Pedobacter africanus]MDR6782334.1 ferric-dicitrate binding protein FerR (iron transport regulator) [Pedobacter africanus]
MAKLYHKTQRVPFIVLTKGQEVDVLGTHFNVRAYPNEKAIKTTLLEGSVRVIPAGPPATGPDPTLVDPLYVMKTKTKAGIILKPNQQAVLEAQQVSIKTVNAMESIAWTKDDFTFRNTPLKDVLGVVAGWHNLKVVYDNSALGNILLGGELQKSESMANILTSLELTANVRFKVKGKQVTVYNRRLISYK